MACIAAKESHSDAVGAVIESSGVSLKVVACPHRADDRRDLR